MRSSLLRALVRAHGYGDERTVHHRTMSPPFIFLQRSSCVIVAEREAVGFVDAELEQYRRLADRPLRDAIGRIEVKLWTCRSP
jgi:hypothetical protein